MMNLNAIQFAAGLSVDFDNEIEDLHEMITEARDDESKIDDCVRCYSHLGSFLQGIDYILSYFEESENREQLLVLSQKTWQRDLQNLWAPVIELKYSRELGKKVRIVTTAHTDGTQTYDVTVNDLRNNFEDKMSLRDWLKSLKD